MAVMPHENVSASRAARRCASPVRHKGVLTLRARCSVAFLIRGAAARGAGRVNNLVPVSDEVQIEEVREVFGGLVPAIDRLVKQLSKSAAPPTQAELDAIVDSHASRLLIARDADGTIVGMLTLALFRIPTGVRA